MVLTPVLIQGVMHVMVKKSVCLEQSDIKGAEMQNHKFGITSSYPKMMIC